MSHYFLSSVWSPLIYILNCTYIIINYFPFIFPLCYSSGCILIFWEIICVARYEYHFRVVKEPLSSICSKKGALILTGLRTTVLNQCGTCYPCLLWSLNPIRELSICMKNTHAVYSWAAGQGNTSVEEGRNS